MSAPASVSTACPPFVAAFVADHVTATGRDVRVIVDLWASPDGLLGPLASRLAPVTAIGVIADDALPPPRPGLQWRRGALDDLPDTLDLVVGVPPWPWHPRHQTVRDGDAVLEIGDDPANVALVRACLRLAADGLAMVVVGPGFVLRPGPRTALPVLRSRGIHVEALLELPRGLFRPDSGSGRWLVGLGRRPAARPLTGRLRGADDGGYDLVAAASSAGSSRQTC